MRRRALIVATIVLVAGLLSAFVSAPLVSARRANQFLGTYAAVAPETTTFALPREAVAIVSIQSDLLEPPAEQFHGLLAPLLRRSTCFLPLREPAAAFPRAWAFARSRPVGPFLMVTDIDGAWDLGRAAHVNHQRTLDVSFGPWSYALSSWTTGAAYHGIRRGRS